MVKVNGEQKAILLFIPHNPHIMLIIIISMMMHNNIDNIFMHFSISPKSIVFWASSRSENIFPTFLWYISNTSTMYTLITHNNMFSINSVFLVVMLGRICAFFPYISDGWIDGSIDEKGIVMPVTPSIYSIHKAIINIIIIVNPFSCSYFYCRSLLLWHINHAFCGYLFYTYFGLIGGKWRIHWQKNTTR